MKDDRLRVPVDDEYMQAVGLATICFARLEWDAVWCCEKMQPGYASHLSKKTAGRIADDLVKMAGHHTNPAIKESLGKAAAEFERLVGRRNDLVHGNPGTTKDDEQRLFRHGEAWSLQMVQDVADDFVAAGIPLNHHHNNLLP